MLIDVDADDCQTAFEETRELHTHLLALIPVRPITIDVGPHGKLRGVEAVAPDGHVKARRFLQVPYAYPPVGDLRWRKPKALPEDFDWSNVPGERFGAYTSQPTYHMKNP